MPKDFTLHAHGRSKPAAVHCTQQNSNTLRANPTVNCHRIISIFVILAGTLLFGLPPLLMKRFQNPDAVVPRLLRAFAGGVILALSLVHIIPSVSFTEPQDPPDADYVRPSHWCYCSCSISSRPSTVCPSAHPRVAFLTSSRPTSPGPPAHTLHCAGRG